MPESATLPQVLRDGLSAFEQSVLTMAASANGDASRTLVRNLDGVKNEEQAERLIVQTREKAGRLLSAARATRGGSGMAKCSKHGEYTERGRGCPVCNVSEGGGARPRPAAETGKSNSIEPPEFAPQSAVRPRRRARTEQREESERQRIEREEREERELPRNGWPHTGGVVRKQVVVNDEDPGAAKRAHEGLRAPGSILPPEPDERPLDDALRDAAGLEEHEDFVSSEEDRTRNAGDAGAPPKMRPASPAESSTPAGDPPAETDTASDSDALSDRHQTAGTPRTRSDGRAQMGERRRQFFEFVREHGPVRQRDVRAALGMSSPDTVHQVGKLASIGAIERGPLVQQSPLLRVLVADLDTMEKVEPVAWPGEDGPTDAGEEQRTDAADAVGGTRAAEDEGAPPSAPPSAEGEPPDLTADEESARTTGGDGETSAASVPPRTAPAPRALSPEEERTLRDVRQRIEQSRRATARIADDVVALASEMADELPPDLLRARYLAVLLKRIEAGDTSPDLLDRFERLAGFEE